MSTKGRFFRRFLQIGEVRSTEITNMDGLYVYGGKSENPIKEYQSGLGACNPILGTPP